MIHLILLTCCISILMAFCAGIMKMERHLETRTYWNDSPKGSDDEVCLDPVVENVVKMLRDRSRLGVAKYKKTLWENDTKQIREWVTEVQEELLDATNYLEKIKTLF